MENKKIVYQGEVRVTVGKSVIEMSLPLKKETSTLLNRKKSYEGIFGVEPDKVTLERDFKLEEGK